MILRLERVAKLFGGFAALRDATAEFEAGKLYLITGENGAGKSTLLRMIAGLMAPSRGRIVWTPGAEAPDSFRNDIPRLKPGVYPKAEMNSEQEVSVGGGAHTTAGEGAGATEGHGGAGATEGHGGAAAAEVGGVERPSLGYMAHATMLYDELSGMENLRYFAKLYEIGDGRCGEQEKSHGGGDEACVAAMGMVGLDAGLKRPVGQYSQGMRQRLALARAMVHSPSILLLDEPFSNLDVGSARYMVEVLAGQRERGTCVLLVTHQASLVEEAADCHLHISGGVMREVKARSSSARPL
ncbi:MAG: ABC transporter ATP-binding protein [Acidobacteriaceae bacterium]